ncbi:hypothetical protein EYF80_050960 [Liparis tanakae]|uniref:Uncharacterized protein n=1 Tax=Liparis tanakae TaxID=230148 RepID=A0A4Z2FDB8_9TELE|nr:hypothetical protein EYF80_050960 [Liparis tanakae]
MAEMERAVTEVTITDIRMMSQVNTGDKTQGGIVTLGVEARGSRHEHTRGLTMTPVIQPNLTGSASSACDPPWPLSGALLTAESVLGTSTSTSSS